MKNNFEKTLPGGPGFKKNKETKKLENPEIDRLEKPTEVILEKILGNIERGEYDLIIGADASGRIPTLVFKKFIDYVYQKLGYPLPKTRFLAGAGMGLRDKEIAKKAEESFLPYKRGGAKEYIEKFSPKRVLIVEDTIVRGSSIHFLCEILNKMRTPFDIVSISSYQNNEDLETTRAYLGAQNIYVGTAESIGIYGSRHLSGVRKEREQVFSRPYKQEISREDEKLSIQKKINQARKDIDIVTGRIIDWYESQK